MRDYSTLTPNDVLKILSDLAITQGMHTRIVLDELIVTDCLDKNIESCDELIIP